MRCARGQQIKTGWECRAHAAECRTLAYGAAKDFREELLEMANLWEDLARDGLGTAAFLRRFAPGSAEHTLQSAAHWQMVQPGTSPRSFWSEIKVQVEPAQRLVELAEVKRPAEPPRNPIEGRCRIMPSLLPPDLL
jgi:hypothetical protein